MDAPPTIRAPYEGVLALPDATVRCFVTERGASYLSVGGVVRAITGEAMTTWGDFVRTLPGVNPAVGEAVVVRVRPKRGPAVEAVPSTVLPDFCSFVVDAFEATEAPTEAEQRRAARCRRVLDFLHTRGLAALARRGAPAGGAS